MKTRLIIVSGSPASGKTTLAALFQEHLGYPRLWKDHFKDALMDISTPTNRAESSIIGRFSWAVLYAALDAVLGTTPGVILEANFTHGYAERELLPRIARSDAILVHCAADRATVLDRIRSRSHDQTRHAGHFDQDAVPDLLRLLDDNGYRLDLPDVPLIEVDTTDGLSPPLPTILGQLTGTI